MLVWLEKNKEIARLRGTDRGTRWVALLMQSMTHQVPLSVHSKQKLGRSWSNGYLEGIVVSQPLSHLWVLRMSHWSLELLWPIFPFDAWWPVATNLLVRFDQLLVLSVPLNLYSFSLFYWLDGYRHVTTLSWTTRPKTIDLLVRISANSSKMD